MGVDSPTDRARQIDFVLGKFSPTEREPVAYAITRAIAALKIWADAERQPSITEDQAMADDQQEAVLPKPTYLVVIPAPL